MKINYKSVKEERDLLQEVVKNLQEEIKALKQKDNK